MILELDEYLRRVQSVPRVSGDDPSKVIADSVSDMRVPRVSGDDPP